MTRHVLGRSELIVICHAVVEEPLPVADPCFVDAATFRQQMIQLTENFDVVPLAKLAAALARRRSRPVAAVTFDDGFLNNHTVALPILKELGIPATVFLCSGFVDTDRTMWFCELNRALSLTDARSLSWDGDELDLSNADARAVASLRVQSALKTGTPSELRSRLDSVLSSLGFAADATVALDSPYRMLTTEAIADMAASGLIEFGAHTESHPILSRLPAEQQEQEITGSIRAVERLTDGRCRLFAYPNGMPGDYDDATLKILVENGIETAVTALPGSNGRATPRFELHRQGFAPDFAVPRWAATFKSGPARRPREDRIRLLFAYPFCGLGGVETATIAKIDALERAGIEAWVYFHQLYGGGGAEFTTHPRVMIGLEDEPTLAALLDQDWDAISLIDYTALLPLIDEYQVRPQIIFESHAGLTSFQDRVYPKLTHSRIKAIVLPSLANAERLRATVAPQSLIAVIPNAVDPHLFDPAVAAVDSGVASLRDDERPILWIGRLEDEKNPQEMIAIADALLARGERVRFVIVGDAPGHYESTRAELQGLMNERTRLAIDFVQAVPHAQMPDLYRWVAERGGVLLSTSRFETQPMIFLEAMAAACPVVSSDVGSIRELITDSQNGRLYQLGDVESGATAVSEVLRRDPDTFEMIDRARDLVISDYSPDAVARRYRELLEGLGLPQPRPQQPSSEHGGDTATSLATEMAPGLVSTIIPLHDRPALLRQAVASVQAQTYQSLEIVLADDGSAEETRLLCDRLAALDTRIRVVHLEHIGLAGPVREAGRQAARGEFIQYLDSDDLLTPRKFELMVASLRDHPDRDIAYCLTRRYIVGERRANVAAERTGEAHTEMLPSFLSQRYWHASTPVYRRRMTDLAGPWTDLRAWEDIEYDMRIASFKPRIVYCPEYLADVRDHASTRLSRQYWFNDPWMLREALRALALVHGHARRGGMSMADDEMRDLLDDVRFLAFNCQNLGLKEDVERATALMREIAGDVPIGEIGMPKLSVELDPELDVMVGDPGETIELPVRVVNRSSITLRHGLLPIGLSYHLLGADGQVVAWDNARVFISPPLRPGQERVVPLPVRAPAVPGRYRVEIDLVWESVTWFKDAGSVTVSLPLIVGDQPTLTSEPLVSVVIPAYNQATYLVEAVESVRWQTYSNWECLIVDDGSTDRTALVGRALAAQDERVQYHQQANQGLSATRNAGFALSGGKYVQFLDADDVLAPTKLQRQVQVMERDSAIGVSYSNYWRFDGATGERLERSAGRVGSQPLEDFLFLWERGLTIPVHAGLFRRDLWPDQSPFDPRLRGREDWLMWVDLALRGTEMSFLDADLAWYRIHDANMVHDRPQMLGWLLEAAELISARIPAQYRTPFVDETVRYIGITARDELGGEAGPRSQTAWRDAAEGLEIMSRQMARRERAADSHSVVDLVDELRLVASALRARGMEAEAERLNPAIQAVAGPSGATAAPTLRAHLEAGLDELSASPAEVIDVPVRVRNDSDVALRRGTYTGFALSYHLRGEDGDIIEWDNARVPFEETLRPTEERLVRLSVQAPSEPGEYVIEADIVCEGITWFGEAGSATLTLPLSVSGAAGARTSVSASATK